MRGFSREIQGHQEVQQEKEGTRGLILGYMIFHFLRISFRTKLIGGKAAVGTCYNA
jgi:hypothetical protein